MRQFFQAVVHKEAGKPKGFKQELPARTARSAGTRKAARRAALLLARFLAEPDCPNIPAQAASSKGRCRPKRPDFLATTFKPELVRA